VPDILLDMKKVMFAYNSGGQALAGVDFAVEAGAFAAIVGRNGSGKTTLTRMAMSLIKPASGTISFGGQDTAKLTPADMARSIGYVFQNPDRQIFRDTVAKEVAYGPEQLAFTPEEINQSVAWALRVTGLTELAGSFPRLLSRGQKQKVAIASAIAMRPKMLILDEPTSGQDPWDAQNLMELLTELNQQGITILLVTHDMELIAKYVDRVTVLDSGNKVFDGKPSELFNGNHTINAWGLLPPTTVALGRQLAGITADNAEELIKQVTTVINRRKEDHA